MRLRIGFLGMFSAMIGLYACVAGAREWSDVTGKYKIEATFVDFKDGKVRLKKPTGDTVSVPLAKLRQEDQKFVMVQILLHAKEATKEVESDAPKASPAPSSTTTTAPATSAASQEAMFQVVKTEIVEKPVEVNGCRVTPKTGCVLYVCTVNFTKAGTTLSHEALGKLKVAEVSKRLSKRSPQGNVISKGDFCLRLEDDTTVPCYCLPAANAAAGLPIRPPRARGGDNWLMYCGDVRFLASMKPDMKPEALVWGGAYEAPVAPSATAAATQSAQTVVAQAPPKASSNPGSAPVAKTVPNAPNKAATATAAQAAETARRDQRARRMANLNKGALHDLLAKHPELGSMEIGSQLIGVDELWDDKDQFNAAAFEVFWKRAMGGR
jgi:hypothetical protein